MRLLCSVNEALTLNVEIGFQGETRENYDKNNNIYLT